MSEPGMTEGRPRGGKKRAARFGAMSAEKALHHARILFGENAHVDEKKNLPYRQVRVGRMLPNGDFFVMGSGKNFEQAFVDAARGKDLGLW
jgi:hypothetical protein